MILLFFLAASVHGTVTDPQKHPAQNVVVSLQGNPALNTTTDSRGEYRFPSVPAGAYTIKAGNTTAGPFDLSATESKQIDLTLAPPFDFDDEPNFVVAGVTDTTARGGHGSDTVMRSAESLAQATAALGKPASDDPLKAVHAYQQAAERDPTEPNFFNWGSELLVHYATDPAIEVFNKGVRLHPDSTRTLLGLAAALYTNGAYSQAAQRFFEACDQNPSKPQPYLFLAKVQAVAITDLPGYTERMARFAKLQPSNAWAQYYYAVSLWKHHEHAEEVAALLNQALQLDPKLGEAYLQLGILHFDQGNLTLARKAFEQAIQVNPALEEAHYRLAQTYRRLGNQEAARQELAIYGQLSKANRPPEMQRFIYELRR
jgi:tetratricopeptide (TPR) repeat protein